mmetsp:Transcript_825/g.2068  ORF Transcript_825/g.2068 Transcript_825/m.2068 type:complete len:298 (+) Transcript_825:211-1104(+)
MTALTYASDATNQTSFLSFSSIASVASASDESPVARSTDTISGGDEEGESSAPLSMVPGQSSRLGDSGGSQSGDDGTKAIVKNKPAGKGKKRVSWDRIHTREFVLVVGDHPMCQDGLPVSLGWQYNDYSCSTKSMNPVPAITAHNVKQDGRNAPSPIRQQEQHAPQTELSERRQSYIFPRRLSYEERRERLVSVSNLTLDQIKNDEIDLVVRNLKESWDVEDRMDESGQVDYDIVMQPIEIDNAIYPFDDDNWMELDDMGMVPGVDLNAEDLGDITNFEWIDSEVRNSASQKPVTGT